MEKEFGKENQTKIIQYIELEKYHSKKKPSQDNIKELYVGVPVIIGEKGIEKIVELTLDADEQKSFQTSIDAVRELFNAAKKIDPSLA